MREPSVIVKRNPITTLILDLKRKVAEKRQAIQVATVEMKSLERDLYLLEKSANIPSGSSDSP
jgi:hypothetical protein